MIRELLNWLDDRTGYRHYAHHALYENIPGGARWRYVTGSMLVFAFMTQTITGIFLWMCYSPSSQNAYESVYWIQNELQGGWLLRGIHHFMAQAMVVLLPLHFLQVVIDKAYRRPREFNFWTGLILMLITLGLSLTGYLLPWDQKGYWATKVATNLMALAPGGEQLQKLVVGGEDYGHYTLTRFFALHAGVLPALLVFFLMLHISLFRRHGITAEPSVRRPDQHFWPYQVVKDGVACLLLLAIVLAIVTKGDLPALFRGSGNTAQLGADLGPPADAVEDYKAARPEWYFLFLFQFLKKFEQSEFFGAIVVPSLVLGFMFLMPILGRWRAGHALNVVVMGVLIIGIIYLTGEALYEDHYSEYFTKAPDKSKGDKAVQEYKDRFKASKDYLSAVELGEEEYERVREIAHYYGIPRDGLMTLVRNDPEIQGRRLFRDKCASCHSYLDKHGHGVPGPEADSSNTANAAPNLYNFGSRSWLKGFLDPKGIVSADYFGRTAHGAKDANNNYPSGGMVEFVQTNLGALDDEGKKALDDLVTTLSAEAQLASQKTVDAEATKGGVLDRGKTAFTDRFACTDCHKFHDVGEETAPDLTGYASLDWVKLMISNPAHERLYENGNDRMPAFAQELTPQQIELIAKFIRGDERELGK